MREKPRKAGYLHVRHHHDPQSDRSTAATHRQAMEIFDSILKYLSIATVAGAAISFVVGLIKYLDQRNREEKTKRYEIYHGLMRKISAQGDKPNEGLPLTQQVAAVYEL